MLLTNLEPILTPEKVTEIILEGLKDGKMPPLESSFYDMIYAQDKRTRRTF